jgi:hypothetical protein
MEDGVKKSNICKWKVEAMKSKYKWKGKIIKISINGW